MQRNNQLTLGIDLGGTSSRIGLFNADMELLDSRVESTTVPAGPANFVRQVVEMIAALKSAASLPIHDHILGLGIGSPGPINLRTGVLGHLPNLPGWGNFPLRQTLSDAVGLPVYLESDANAAAIAEWKLGAGRTAGLDSLAMLTLGTGVGSGLILHGRVWHGMFGMGGEVGHSTIDPDGPLCGCGSHGCLEMYTSAGALVRLTRQIACSAQSTPALRELVEHGRGFTSRRVAELALVHGDAAASSAFQQFGTYLGIGIAGIINTLDLPMVIVGGGVANAWPLFAPGMFQAVRDYSVVYRLARPSQIQTLEHDCTFICPAELGPAAGLLGAAMLPRLEHSQDVSYPTVVSGQHVR